MRRSLPGLAVLAVIAAGCSTSTGSTAGGPGDAGADVTTAPYDAGLPGLDAGGVDTGGSAPPDAANDVGTDAAPAGPTPYACPSGAPAAVYVSEVAPPPTMAPWAHASTSVTYANCGTATWSATAAPPNGIKLGAAAPHDLGTWTPTRIALPADVPAGYAITIPIEAHAPPLTGPHAYAFDLVQDGVAWLGQPSPTHTIDVEPAAAPPVVLCGTTTADPTGGTDAAAALQACIDATPSGGTLALPAGIFRLASVVSITQPMTLTTTGVSGAPNCLDYASLPCAVLRADTNVLPSASSTRGFFRLGSPAAQVTGVTLDHVVVDGDRADRLASSAASACASGQNGNGINVGANCASCTLAHMVSARALCGSGMEWDGDGITVTDSVFFGNGDHDTQNMWSDGLTIHTSNGARSRARASSTTATSTSSRGAAPTPRTRTTRWSSSPSRRSRA